MAARKRKQRPEISIAVQPNVRQFTNWTTGTIRAAELSADSGNLRLAAELCDWILADDRVASTMETRVQALLGLPVEFEASGDKRRSSRAVRALEADEDWWQAYPESESFQIIAWGLLLGIGPAQHRWVANEDHGGRILPMPEFWHPMHMRYDFPAQTWKTRTAVAGGYTGGSDEDVVAGDGIWILHTPYGAIRPWARGMWRSLSWLILAKWYARQDWARCGEKGGILAVTAAANPDTQEVTKEERQVLAEQVNVMGRNSALILPAGFDAKLIATSANTQELYDAQIKMCNDAIAVRVRGGNLGTDMKGGSLAAAESQERTTDQPRLRFDAQSYTSTIHDQSLRWWAAFNFGDPKLAPWPVYEVEPETDQKDRATVYSTVATSLTAFKTAGYEVDPKQIEEEFGIKLTKLTAPAVVAPANPAGVTPPADPTQTPDPNAKPAADPKQTPATAPN